MKATINGIAVEGTPAEIAEYQKIMDDMRRDGIYIKPPLGKPPGWLVKEQHEQGKFCGNVLCAKCMGLIDRGLKAKTYVDMLRESFDALLNQKPE